MSARLSVGIGHSEIMHSADQPNLPLHMQLTERPTLAGVVPPLQGRRIRLQSQLIDFSELIPKYGSQVVSAWLDGIAKASAQGRAIRPGRLGRALESFFSYVAVVASDPTSDRAEARAYASLLAGSAPTLVDFEASLLGYIQRVRDLTDLTALATLSARSRLNNIGNLFVALREIGPYVGWPSISWSRTYGVGLRHLDRPVQSLGELNRSPNAEPSQTHSLATIRDLNQERLAALREVLVNVFESHWRVFCEGQEHIARADLPDEATLDRAVSELPADYGFQTYDQSAQTLANACFPLGDDGFRRCALLKYIANCRAGFVRRGKRDTPWGRLLDSCGGMAWLTPRLAGNGQALAAAQGIILVDTGFNVQPCNDLLVEPVVLRAKRGRQLLSTVTSNKMRAGGKLVLAVLREFEASVSIRSQATLNSLEVISRWRRMSEVYRHLADREQPDLSKFLWIRAPMVRTGPLAIAPASDHHWSSLREHFNRHPALRGLAIVRRNVRVTVLQIERREADLGTAAASLVAGHSQQSTTLRHYFNRGWFHSEMDELIRSFQERFEAILLPDLIDPLEQIGLTAGEIATRKSAAIESGLVLPLKERAMALMAKYEGEGLTFQYDASHSPLVVLRPLAQEIGVHSVLSLSKEARECFVEAIRARGLNVHAVKLPPVRARPGSRPNRLAENSWTAGRVYTLLRPLDLNILLVADKHALARHILRLEQQNAALRQRESDLINKLNTILPLNQQQRAFLPE